jgi:hypothetical protein
VCSSILVAETVVVSPSTAAIPDAPVTKEVVVVPSAPVTKEIVVEPSTTSVAPLTKEEVIVTPAPAAKEVIETPSGYAYCFTVNSGWFNHEWIPEHRICQYENTPGKVAWIEGYWACTKYKMDEGICTDWKWRAGHWTETLKVY